MDTEPRTGCAIILHGPIGGGKTTTARDVAERIRRSGHRVMGILSIRVPDNEAPPSYDITDLETGRSFPHVKPREKTNADSDDWESFGNPVFTFSKKGLAEANSILTRASQDLGHGAVVFVDEYGRLESRGLGIHIGFTSVVESLRRGGLALILCRDDKVSELKSTLERSGIDNVSALEAGDPERVWKIVKRHLGTP